MKRDLPDLLPRVSTPLGKSLTFSMCHFFLYKMRELERNGPLITGASLRDLGCP